VSNQHVTTADCQRVGWVQYKLTCRSEGDLWMVCIRCIGDRLIGVAFSSSFSAARDEVKSKPHGRRDCHQLATKTILLAADGQILIPNTIN
jgi:hypothetical protein